MVQIDTTQLFQSSKLEELIIHISEKSEGDPNFGATKLNKILFYADFLSFLHFGKSITNQRYQKLDHGPAPRAIVPVVKQLEQSGAVACVDRMHYGKKQKRTVALRQADYSVFDAREIAFVDQLIQDCWDKTAKEISEKSHKFIGWQAAANGEDIPYVVALVGYRKPTEAETEYGYSLEERARELAANAG